MAKITGIVRLTMNGELLESLPEAELDLGGEEKESVSGHRVYGTRSKIMPSKLTCTVVWKNGSPIEDLRNFTDGTGIFQSDNGEAYTIDNLTRTAIPKVKGGSGEVDFEFEGDPAKKL